MTLKNKSYSIEQRLVTPSVVSNSKCTTTYSLKKEAHYEPCAGAECSH